MSSYFRPDPFGAVLLRLAETDRDVRRPELFLQMKSPLSTVHQYTILSGDLQLFVLQTGCALHPRS